MPKPILIISHRRSGTHFLYQTLKKNFVDNNIMSNINKGGKMHKVPSSCNIDELNKKRSCIFITRDGRDSLVSSWYWFKSGSEGMGRIKDVIESSGFSAFLHGDLPKNIIRKRFDGSLPGMYLMDPVKNWTRYAEWKKHVYTVKFEELKKKPKEVIIGIRDNFGFSLKNNKDIKTVNRLVGHKPRHGKIGKWKGYFSKEDEEYFWEIAGEYMRELGYER